MDDTGMPDAASWRRIDALFAEILEVPEAERDHLLLERCGNDEELRRKVESLLAVDSLFLNTQADGSLAQALGDALGDAPPDRSGTRLGPYRLVSRIGRGGMADVYLAERDDGRFEQRVAVKIQRRGLDTEDLLSRFRAERQILSDLSHPNIARLIDGGATEDGLPYLVMEYVDGRPITAYCEEHGLPVRERLRLFEQVARAVQAAHASLTVHRDIKPSNVLVTQAGHVKLLDFGIAKILDPTTLPVEVPRTRTGARLLTPEYASPEQVRGDSITTASDIYQLGLLLYEILTGGRPYGRNVSGRALQDAITGTGPSKPSEFIKTHGMTVETGLESAQLARRLRGDLDTIVLVALRKESERRYPSAFEMAEDIRRHLAGRPIWARRDSRVYRARRFLQRNPWIAPSFVAVNVAMALYVGTLIRHGHQMESERNAARLEAERARETQEFLVGLFRSADPFAPISDSRLEMRVSDVMDQGIRRARTELIELPELQVQLLATIGDVFLGLGDPERSVELHREAYEIASESFGSRSREAAIARRELIEPTVHWIRREPVMADSAVFLGVDALNDIRQAFGEDHIETARAEIAVASAMLYSSMPLAGEVIVRHALAKLDASAARAPVERADGLMVLTRILMTRGSEHWSEAVDVGRDAVTAFEIAYGDNHPWTWSMRLRLARMLPNPVEEDSLRRAAIEAFEEQLGAYHDATIAAHLAEAVALQQRGNHSGSADEYRLVLDRRLDRGDDPRSGWLATLTRGYADAARTAGRYTEAETAYREALAAARASATVGLPYEVSVQARLAWTLADLGRPAEALHEALAARQLVAGSAADPLLECVLGRVFRVNGRHGEADSVIVLAAARLAETGYIVRDYHPCWGIVPTE